MRQFLIDNATRFIDDFHADGFRYDEVSVMSNNGGTRFCRDLTDTLHYYKPAAIHIAEYWNWDRATAVLPSPQGLGFDAALHDGLRHAVRDAVAAAAGGASAAVNLDAVRDALGRPEGFPAAWKAVNHLENHDLVDADREDASQVQPRVPALAHWDNHRDWLARSRSRVATALLLTAPGIPMLFMGEEFLEDKPWHNSSDRTDLLIDWSGPDEPGPRRDFLRFTRELCWLRRRHPALTGEHVDAYYTHNDNRVLAFHRWRYVLPFPADGHWHEVFNSDAYDSLPPGDGYNPGGVGNPGGVTANGPPLDGYPTTAAVVIPANAVLVFARDLGNPGS